MEPSPRLWVCFPSKVCALSSTPQMSHGFRRVVPVGLAGDSPLVPPDSSLWVWGCTWPCQAEQTDLLRNKMNGLKSVKMILIYNLLLCGAPQLILSRYISRPHVCFASNVINITLCPLLLALVPVRALFPIANSSHLSPGLLGPGLSMGRKHQAPGNLWHGEINC